MKNKSLFKKLIFIVIIISFFSLNFIVKEVNDLDELWNYNFARNIANGLIPYKDFNMIVTPTLSLICGFVMFIFGQELYIMRILAVILNTAIIFMVYKNEEILEINKTLKIGIIVLILYLLNNLFAIDYNFTIALNTLIIMYLELKKINMELKLNIKYDLIIGILLGIGITIKQTVGIVVTLAFCGYFIIFNIKNKEAYKKFFIRILGATIPCLIMLFILAVNGAIYDFFDYCILGIKTFSNSIPYKNIIQNQNLVVKLLGIIIPLSIFLSGIIGIVKKEKNCQVLFAVSISLFVIAFPISDRIHFSIAIIPSIIGLAYLLNMYIHKLNILKNEFLITFISTALTLCFILIFIFQYSNLIRNIKNVNINTTLKNYKYLNINQSSIKDIQQMDEFILNQEKKVYILDATAAYYMITVDRYNKDYDMFNLGNLGSKGEDGLIERIKNEQNILYLVRNENYARNWQTPEKVRKYIIQNMDKIGEIGIFDIYEN